MNKPNTEIKRWGIVVIQSLYPNDVKTGEILYHDVLQYKEYHKRESFSSFYDVNSSKEFRLAVQGIEESILEGDILTLQIETHGSDEGIGFNNGEILKWKDFYNIIRPLNIKTGHLLFVVMAMCKSIAMISAINPEERAPYRAFICTTRNVTSDEICRGFLAFYDKYFNLLDISQALAGLQNEVKDDNGYSPFQALSAESVFDETFNPNRNISSLVDNQLKQLNIPITDSTKSIMSYYIQQLLENLHNRFCNYYNFKDLY
ncbi:MAG: hypothetical protein VZR36_01995 [Prevotella sp.]|nr:hypothetical protein [Prevotella sp.]